MTDIEGLLKRVLNLLYAEIRLDGPTIVIDLCSNSGNKALFGPYKTLCTCQ